MVAPFPVPVAPDGALRLLDWGVIRASGADARSFLHGQLTQDILHIDPGQARLAGLCSPKGRLLASFVAWAAASDEVLLACSADLLEATLKRLQMFVLRAKCRLSDASAELAIYGLAGPSAEQWLGRATDARAAPWSTWPHAGGQVILLPPAHTDEGASTRYLFVAPAGGPAPQLPALPAAAWLALEAASGVVRIVQATREQFVPQMVNLELVGGVSFTKGCYPGQEVVARSQYRGTLKRRTFLARSAATLQPGQELFHSADPGQPAGMVALAGSLGGGENVALVELKLEAARGGELHLAAPDGPALVLGRLPYELPVDTA